MLPTDDAVSIRMWHPIEGEPMQIHEVDYTHSTAEIEEMSSLLVKSYAVSLKPFNWRLAVFENYIYSSRYLQPVETYQGYLWTKLLA